MEKEFYEKFYKKRGIERHLEQKKRIEKAEPIKEVEGEIDRIRKAEEIALQRIEKGEEKTHFKDIIEEIQTPETPSLEIQQLEGIVSDLEKEIKTKYSPEEIEGITKGSKKRLWKYARKRKLYKDQITALENAIKNIQERIKKEKRESFIEKYRSELNRAKEYIEEINQKLKFELPFENPESFLATALYELREFKKQLPSGIVETDYVKTKKEEVISALDKSRLAALVGETGTGKTRLARKIAEELSPQGKYEFIPGHKYTTKEDLLYVYGIEPKGLKKEEIPKILEDIDYLIKEEKEKHPDLSEEELKERIKNIREIITISASTSQIETKFLEAGILKAAQEGKIAIIDEFNYIPPAILGSLNVLIEAKPGEEVSIGDRKIKVKPGFGIILTGNITTAQIRERYIGREKIDSAFANRLNSGLIEYGSLPQSYSSFQESILSEADFEKGKKISARELFQVGLTILASEKGNIKGPKNLLEKVWDLLTWISLLQKTYAGEKLDTPLQLPGGKDVVLKEYAISNRTFRAILEGWEKDGYRYSIDWYIYNNLIRPASIISPSEAGQIFLILRESGMFFQDKSWGILKAGDAMQGYRLEGIERIERDKNNFLKTQEIEKEIHYFTPKEIAEAFMGIKMPLKGIEPEGKKKKISIEEIEMRGKELSERYAKVKNFIEEWEEIVNSYCPTS